MKAAGFFAHALIAASLVSVGFFGAEGLKRFSSENRVVTVKGVSEREVEADMAYWTIRHVSKAETLDEARARLKNSQKEVRAYLQRNGISDEEVQVKRVELQENSIPDEFGRYTKMSYSLTENLMVRSEKPKVVEKASQAIVELIDKGVFLEGNYNPDFEPVYTFTRLNDFKPEMIAEATRSARQAAQQFADDSSSKIGKIKLANQGLFQILGRDKAVSLNEYSQREKTLRVVVTLDYFLE
jgi:hypothetical protein